MPKQLEFEKVKGWGGRRRGAGRPNRTGRVSHARRDSVDFKKPLHITLKLMPKMIRLRNKTVLKSFRLAVNEAKAFGLHVIHFSLQDNHIHLIIEAESSDGLGRGMKSLCGRLGKAIRRLTGGAGPVFYGRYHLHILRSPSEMKRALAYVLLNTSKHMKVLEHIDRFSSALAFREWKALLGRGYRGLIEDQYRNLPVQYGELSSPRSWLCREGWKRAS